MPESPEDDRGAQAGGGPAEGTTGAGAGGAAQGAEGGTAAAPEQGTTEQAGGQQADGEQVLQLGRSEPAKEGEGAQPSGDEATRLRDKLSYTQPRSDAYGRMAKLAQEEHPDWFDKEGNFVGPSKEGGGGGGAGGKTEDGALALGPSGREQEQASQQGYDWGDSQFDWDPQVDGWRGLNEKAARAMFEQDDVLRPTAVIMEALLASRGIDLNQLAQLSQGGVQGGLSEEQVAQMVAQRSRQELAQYEQEKRAFDGRVDAIAAAAGPEFLQQTVKFDDRPNMSLEDALPYICARTGEPDPFWAIQKDPVIGQQVQQAMIDAKAAEKANEIVAKAQGLQLAPGGQAFPGAGQTSADKVERAGGAHEPLKR